MSKSYQKKYRDNMTDEQKQRYRDKQRKYRDNMTDEQKHKDIEKLIDDIKKNIEII